MKKHFFHESKITNFNFTKTIFLSDKKKKISLLNFLLCVWIRATWGGSFFFFPNEFRRLFFFHVLCRPSPDYTSLMFIFFNIPRKTLLLHNILRMWWKREEKGREANDVMGDFTLAVRCWKRRRLGKPTNARSERTTCSCTPSFLFSENLTGLCQYAFFGVYCPAEKDIDIFRWSYDLEVPNLSSLDWDLTHLELQTSSIEIFQR